MSYNSRLTIKQRFEYEGKLRVNSLKLIEYDGFVQVYLTNGEKYGSIRLELVAVQQLKEFLEKVEIKS